jgi:hypothetical protein
MCDWKTYRIMSRKTLQHVILPGAEQESCERTCPVGDCMFRTSVGRRERILQMMKSMAKLDARILREPMVDRSQPLCESRGERQRRATVRKKEARDADENFIGSGT